MPEAIAIFDRDDRFVYWNRCFKKLYGGSNDLCAGTNFADFVRARALAGAVPDAVGREEEWIAGRLARFYHYSCGLVSIWAFCAVAWWARRPVDHAIT